MTRRIEPGGVSQPAVVADQNIVHALIGRIGITAFAQVRPRRSGSKGRRQRQTFFPRAHSKNQRHAAPRGCAEHTYALRRRCGQQFAIYRDGVINGRRPGEIRSHSVIRIHNFELSHPCHKNGFQRSGLSRSEDIAAAMQIQQHAIAVGFRQILRGKDEHRHTAHFTPYNGNTKFFP